MRWEETDTQTCSIAKAMSVLGDKWTFLVVRQVFMRIRRFSEIQTSLGIPKHRLSNRLSRLVDSEILYKQPYDKSGTRNEYRLTEKGLDLYPIMIAISQWGDKWMADSDGQPIVYEHLDCGEKTNPELSCSVCNETITAFNTKAKPGPGILKKLARNEFSQLDKKLYSKALGPEK